MKTLKHAMMLLATCVLAVLSAGSSGSTVVVAAGQDANEPLSKTYRVTRARH